RTPLENRLLVRCRFFQWQDQSSGPRGVRWDLPCERSGRRPPALFPGCPFRCWGPLRGQGFAAIPVRQEPSVRWLEPEEVRVTVATEVPEPKIASVAERVVSPAPYSQF